MQKSLIPFDFLFLIGLAIGLSGCGEVTAPAPVATTPPLQSKIIVGEKANEFKVRLNWNADDSVEQWMISRFEGDAETPDKTVNRLSQITELEDEEVKPGVSYRYRLSANPGDKVRAEARITVPYDLAPTSIADLAAARTGTYHRLFLSKDKPITTFGADIDLKVNYLISEAGVIQTFPKGHTADLGKDGRHAGTIRIRAQFASGDLTVIANGEDAGNGIDGAIGATGAAGANGTDGEWDINPAFFSLIENGEKFWEHPVGKHYIENMRSLPGKFPNWGPDDPTWNSARNVIPTYVCSKPTGDGGKGAQGGPGGDGGRGGIGGDTGIVAVSVKAKNNLILVVEKAPGRGGLGGRGGIGGKGGPGGQPGKRDRLHRCAAAKAGAEGDVGIAGRPGNPGVDGKAK